MSAHNPIKVAIADDHKVFKEGIERILDNYPDMHLIIKAENGLDLLDHIKKSPPDVVLLDLRMPVMDGISTLAELKKYYPSIKVIVLTINVERPLIFEASKLEADAYLLKTAEPELIIKAIREVTV